MLSGLTGKLSPELLNFLVKTGKVGKEGAEYAGRMGKAALGKGAELAQEFPTGAAAIGGAGAGAGLTAALQEDEDEILRRYLLSQGYQ